MKQGIRLLRPILANSAIDILLGKFGIGTVAGDIHDIGKNSADRRPESTDFEVIDLGTN